MVCIIKTKEHFYSCCRLLLRALIRGSSVFYASHSLSIFSLFFSVSSFILFSLCISSHFFSVSRFLLFFLCLSYFTLLFSLLLCIFLILFCFFLTTPTTKPLTTKMTPKRMTPPIMHESDSVVALNSQYSPCFLLPH